MKKLLAIFMILIFTLPHSYCVQAAENTIPVALYESDTTEEIGITDIEIEGYVSKFDEQSGDYIFEPIEEIEMMAIEDIYSINPEDIDLETRNFGEYIVEECGLESDDIQNIGDENGITTVASALPDLSVTYLNATTDLLTGQTSRFSYKVSNLGGSIAKDVEMAFIVEDGLAGTFNLGDIEAGKTANAYFVLGAIQNKGRYGIGVYADFNNKIEESDETNNFYGKYFTWYDEEDYNPDLTVEILSPKEGEIWGATKSDDTQTVKFRIYNEGPKPTPNNQEFYLNVYIDRKKFAGMRVSGIPAYTGIPGSFEMGITGYKPFEMEMEIDASNDIFETNEDNNTDTKNYIPKYCIHEARSSWWLPEPGANLKVQIRNNALFGDFTQTFYQENLGAWNGITNKCSIRQCTIANDILDDIQFLVHENPMEIPNNPAGTYTYFDRNNKDVMYNIIELNRKYIEENHFNLAEITRTFIHELGHAFTMGHPNESMLPESDRDTCEYSSIMFQSNKVGTEEGKDHTKISAHDKYGIYKRYNDGIKAANMMPYSANEHMSIYKCRIEEVNSEDVLSSGAECIVRGRILPNSENILTEFSGYTQTDFIIDEVFKGNSLNVNQVIQLQEPYHTEIYSDGTTKFVCYEDYMPSEVGEEYILYITKWEDKELYYLPYTSLSRYTLDNDDIVEFPNSDNPDYTVENYNALKKQVLETYN